MSKPKTLRERAYRDAKKTWPGLSEYDGVIGKSVDLWLAGHRAGSRLTKSDKHLIAATEAFCHGEYSKQDLCEIVDARNCKAKKVRK